MAKTELTLDIEMAKKDLIDLCCDMHNFQEPLAETEDEIDLPHPGAKGKETKGKTVKVQPEKIDVPKLREEFALRILGEIVGQHLHGLKMKQASQTQEMKAVTASF
jgi:hypothetical protein